MASGRPGGLTRTDAIMHLSPPVVQEELATIVHAIETSTLDAERKHNYDRRCEAPTVTSVAKASRDSFVRQWRTSARASKMHTSESEKAAGRRFRFASATSVLYESNPDVFPQAAGKLHWEARSTKKQKSLRTSRADLDGRARETLMAEHGEEYRAEAKRRRDSATTTPTTTSPMSWPSSNASWVQWLDANKDPCGVGGWVLPHVHVSDFCAFAAVPRGALSCTLQRLARAQVISTGTGGQLHAAVSV